MRRMISATVLRSLKTGHDDRQGPVRSAAGTRTPAHHGRSADRREVSRPSRSGPVRSGPSDPATAGPADRSAGGEELGRPAQTVVAGRRPAPTRAARRARVMSGRRRVGSSTGQRGVDDLRRRAGHLEDDRGPARACCSSSGFPMFTGPGDARSRAGPGSRPPRRSRSTGSGSGCRRRRR